MKILWPQRTGALLLTGAVWMAGSCFAAAAASVDLDAALARASALKQPLLLLVVEPGQSQADDAARKLLESRTVKARADRISLFELDISVSRNRAAATRFHIVETPLLLGLTPRGVIASRDEKPLTAGLVLQRIGEVAQQWPGLDAKLAALEEEVKRDPGDRAKQFDLTDFLLAHHNAIEAIPPLENLAHAEAGAPSSRLQAWIELVQAHFWIAEPEKAQHEAKDLMATLGPALPEARAAGEFVLGRQDAGTKRLARARTEFEAAIAAAPDSLYGKQAAQALANLPKDGP